MQLTTALSKIQSLNQPVFRTADVSALLNVGIPHASQILSRLKENGFLKHLCRGVWAFESLKDPYLLPEYLTAPYPAYVSLQTALHAHGMIEQIPSVVYAISLARTKVISTPIGTISIHTVQHDFFFGYTVIGKQGMKLATPEKALLDICYMSTAKTRLFTSLPELEIPGDFSTEKCFEMIEKIKSKKRQTLVKRKLVEFFN